MNAAATAAADEENDENNQEEGTDGDEDNGYQCIHCGGGKKENIHA